MQFWSTINLTKSTFPKWVTFGNRESDEMPVKVKNSKEKKI